MQSDWNAWRLAWQVKRIFPLEVTWHPAKAMWQRCCNVVLRVLLLYKLHRWINFTLQVVSLVWFTSETASLESFHFISRIVTIMASRLDKVIFFFVVRSVFSFVWFFSCDLMHILLFLGWRWRSVKDLICRRPNKLLFVLLYCCYDQLRNDIARFSFGRLLMWVK